MWAGKRLILVTAVISLVGIMRFWDQVERVFYFAYVSHKFQSMNLVRGRRSNRGWAPEKRRFPYAPSVESRRPAAYSCAAAVQGPHGDDQRTSPGRRGAARQSASAAVERSRTQLCSYLPTTDTQPLKFKMPLSTSRGITRFRLSADLGPGKRAAFSTPETAPDQASLRIRQQYMPKRTDLSP